jgi:23S rRNA (guanosine2251-2'-O)-methyltransferase
MDQGPGGRGQGRGQGDRSQRDRGASDKNSWDKSPRDKGARGKEFRGKGPQDRGARDTSGRDKGGRDKGSWDKRPAKDHGARAHGAKDHGPRHTPRTHEKPHEKPPARPIPPPARPAAQTPTRPAAPPRPARKPEPKAEQFPRTYNFDPTLAQQRSPPPRREEVWIYGYHPAAAVLANPQRKILRVVATPEVAERLAQDSTVAAYNLERIRTMDRREIDGLVGADAVHQGVAVLTRPLDHDLHEILAGLEGRANVCLVVLDQVTDPHNVGAILRSAVAFGASAVIAPDRHAPEETGVMAKSASGALDKMPYVKTVNLVRALEVIKESQFWLVGLDGEAPTALSDIDLGGRIALVLGAEGEGIRRLVAETCDHRARLPISNAMESLNVSNAAAVALYEKARQTNKPRGKG